jgi:hypothetical protein
VPVEPEVQLEWTRDLWFWAWIAVVGVGSALWLLGLYVTVVIDLFRGQMTWVRYVDGSVWWLGAILVLDRMVKPANKEFDRVLAQIREAAGQ